MSALPPPTDEKKQHVLNDVTDILGLARWTIKRPGILDGSSLPSHVFEAAALRAGVSYGSMPAANEQVIKKAGLPFDDEYDSRGSVSAGGGTVTLAGLQALREALTILVGPVPQLAGFLLTWNPGKWLWDPTDLADAIDATSKGQIVEGPWSTGGRTGGMADGDRVFLLRQGTDGRGIVASGTVRSEIYQGVHHSDPTRDGNYVDVDWDVVLAPSEALPIEELKAQVPIGHNWEPQGSGTVLPGPALGEVERLWLDHLGARQKAWTQNGSASGQARERDAARRRAVEEAAQKWLEKEFKDAGWLVEDTHISNPFDARATKNGRTVYLEAKGTQTLGGTVIVTRNEIAHALAHPGDCVIGIWSGIRFGKNGKVDPRSGAKTIRDWRPVAKDLAPIAYDWTVGGKAVKP